MAWSALGVFGAAGAGLAALGGPVAAAASGAGTSTSTSTGIPSPPSAPSPAVGATTTVPPSAHQPPGPKLPTLRSRLETPPTLGAAALSGALRAPGGPFLYDAKGRVVLLHGVDAVDKHAPFELYPTARRSWNFSAADASLMARLGFDVVRLGMTWAGLEPGRRGQGPNDPAVCTPGTPSGTAEFSQAALTRYLDRLTKTVDLLGRYHIYTILDMHQDVYNQLFDGEGAPAWAVCTNGIPPTHPPGRWSDNYSTAAAHAAYQNFWTNDVVGNLQGNYDRVWAAVAAHFKANRWVIGYDPFNEPFSASVVASPEGNVAVDLECFYAGTTEVRRAARGASALTCPASDPAKGVIPRIEAADPNHLVFYEPDIFAKPEEPTVLEPMDFPRLVLNVHVYCADRTPVTGNPTNLAACVTSEEESIGERLDERALLGSKEQRGGPALFVSEFGATSTPALLGEVTGDLNAALLGWAYWSWRYYDDPTGSSDEALVTSSGRLRPTAAVLAQTYAQAVAGKPLAMSFNPTSGAFALRYAPFHRVRAPTLVFVPTALHYPHGYCAVVRGGTVVSARNSTELEVENAKHGGDVTVSVSAGACHRRQR